MDAGPVVAGFGVAANAFGTGAARKNGRFDLAYPLSAEMLATVWELPDGTLAVPRLLSNLSDAPMLGEAAILWFLTIQPESGFPVRTGGGVPPFSYVILVGALVLGVGRAVAAAIAFRRALRQPAPIVLASRFQAVLWLSLIAGAAGLLCFGQTLPGFALLLSALLIPRGRKRAANAIAAGPGKAGAEPAGQRRNRTPP